MVRGKTQSGIKYTVNENVKKDARFSYFLTKAMNENIAETERGSAVFSMIAILFGGEDKMIVFMDEVAKKNNGVCDEEVLMREVSEILESIGAKKS